MNTRAPTSVVIIDDHPLFRKGVSQLIALSDQLHLIGEASSGEEGLELARALEPDLILLDLNMRGMSGIETLRALREADLAARILILTVSDAADDLVAAIRALDRVLLSQHYSILNWYTDRHRLAWRNRFEHPPTPPYALALNTWWLKTPESTR